MADGDVTLTLTLDRGTAARLDAVARDAGIATETLVVGLIEDAARPGDLDAERRELARVIAAKGGKSEIDFLRAFDAHPKLAASLRSLLKV